MNKILYFIFLFTVSVIISKTYSMTKWEYLVVMGCSIGMWFIGYVDGKEVNQDD